MASLALYRKWRSQTFAEVVGQQHVTQTLSNALKLNRIAHAYLFTGPRGTGKTSTARLLAKAVNCLAETGAERPCNDCRICVAVNEGRLLDLIEIDAASNTSVDDIRDLRDKVGFRPGEARTKFYIIDEVHMLSNSAFNALLKTLEEPPAHVIFVLATTEPEKIPATITSRCQRFDFKRIKLDDIAQHLAHIVAEEGLTAETPALDYIARQGNGSMRDAISLLDQLTAYGSETITLELVQDVLGMVAAQSVIELVEALIDQNLAGGLDIINRVTADGTDPRQFARELVEYLRSLMLVKLGDGAGLLNLPAETLTALKAQAARTEGSILVRATTLFNNAAVDIKSGLLTIPQLPLELAFVEAATPAVETAAVTGTTTASPTPDPRPPKIKQAEAQASYAVPDEASPESPSPPAEAGNPVAGDITIETVRACLGRVLEDLEQKNKIMAETLRSQTRLYKVSGRELYFITSELAKRRFERPQPKAAVDEAFSRAMGQSVIIHFLTETTASGTPETGDGEQPEADNSDALIKFTSEELGGQVAT
jgi:DNA polymerase-3 subunit gamma/tau